MAVETEAVAGGALGVEMFLLLVAEGWSRVEKMPIRQKASLGMYFLPDLYFFRSYISKKVYLLKI